MNHGECAGWKEAGLVSRHSVNIRLGALQLAVLYMIQLVR